MADFDVNISDGTSIEVVVTPSSAGAGVSDHGELTGLADDDHPQYHTDTRGDARYLQSVPGSYATDAEVATAISDHEAASDPHTGYQKESEKATAGGYASLDGSGLIPDAQIPSGVARDSEVTSAISTHEAASDPHTGYQKESEKDQNSGYAGLNSSGRVPIARLASGTPDGTKFLRDDGVLAAPAGSGNISGAYDIEAGTYTDAGMSDEFASGTLNAKWTTSISPGTIDFPGQPGSACYDLTSRSGTLLLQPAYSTSAGQIISLRQADGLAIGESLILSCALPYLGKYSATTWTYLSFYLNSSTTSPSTGTYQQFRTIVTDPATNSNAPSLQIISSGSSLRAVSIHHAVGSRLYLRVSRKTINSIDSFVWLYSLDGIVWNQVWQNTAAAFTQMWLEVGVLTQTNPSIAPVFPINWIRHVVSTAHDLW